LALDKGRPPRVLTRQAAIQEGKLVVDLSDAWAPFLFSDGSSDGSSDRSSDPPSDASDPPSDRSSDRPSGRDLGKPNAYRSVFLDLANERRDPEGQPMDAGQHLYLEPFGIPPTLSVLAARAEEALSSERTVCLRNASLEQEQSLRGFTDSVAFLDRNESLRQFQEAARDSAWLARSWPRDGGLPSMSDPAPTATQLADFLHDAPAKVQQRAARWQRGQARLRAVRALQTRLRCEHLLTEKVTPGQYDLPTHMALAQWERKNDIFGWGILGGETLAALLRPPRELEAEAFRRFVAERVADAAGIVEDGSASRADVPATYRDVDGAIRPVPNVIEEHVQALLALLGIETPEDTFSFLRQATPLAGQLQIAFTPPRLPAYYAQPFALEVEIDRGDVWYDFVFDRKGKAVNQPRSHYPHLTLFVRWNEQRIPLVDWRTTIGSWRSEKAANGFVYYRYKSSDVGPRIWKNIVAAPTWIPPDGTLPQDLLVRRLRDRLKGPDLEVNTGVMGPGFQSAYGLGMAIHLKDGGFDNQIRTHGSVDYTSIARRFSHGCHRLVNNRAVRLFDFVLRHQAFKRIGQVPLNMHRQLVYQGRSFPFQLTTRGYYYELLHPIAINVLEGRVQGQAKQPLTRLMPKPGVSYAGAEDPASGDANAGVELPDAPTPPVDTEEAP